MFESSEVFGILELSLSSHCSQVCPDSEICCMDNNQSPTTFYPLLRTGDVNPASLSALEKHEKQQVPVISSQLDWRRDREVGERLQHKLVSIFNPPLQHSSVLGSRSTGVEPDASCFFRR
ncbi:unnamed protein product [Clavelina lepadiformis]|uniref:Uncharacterized protein n=1 Tax=Clavelina lepadiformis TaxID=159417 RepID=A0ABP0GZD5_CLALP